MNRKLAAGGPYSISELRMRLPLRRCLDGYQPPASVPICMHAWDNEEWAAGRETLTVAEVWTSVCVGFSSVDARFGGFKLCAALNASGEPSEMASRTTLARLSGRLLTLYCQKGIGDKRAVAAVRDVLDAIGHTCPECRPEQ